jgi:hypothetical protein
VTVRRFIAMTCVLMSLGAGPAIAAAILPLEILYVGNLKTPRAGNFETFLKQHFHGVRIADAKSFKPADAHAADVVLFDWSTSNSSYQEAPVPLGSPEETVAWRNRSRSATGPNKPAIHRTQNGESFQGAMITFF